MVVCDFGIVGFDLHHRSPTNAPNTTTNKPRTSYTTSTKQDKEPQPQQQQQYDPASAIAPSAEDGGGAPAAATAPAPAMPPRLFTFLSRQGALGDLAHVWLRGYLFSLRATINPNPPSHPTHGHTNTASTASSNRSLNHNHTTSHLSAASLASATTTGGGKEKKSKLRTPSYTDRILTHSLPGALRV